LGTGARKSLMNKYHRLIADLEKTGQGSIKCFGNSMKPILDNPSTCVYRVQESYQIHDIVFCKVKGRFIGAHKIVAIENDRYMIANNHGYRNGWTRTIYGKVVSAMNEHGKITRFDE
jgi:hypothetical protein